MKQTRCYGRFMRRSKICLITHIIIVSMVPSALFSKTCQADVRTRSKWLEKNVAVREQTQEKNDRQLSVFPNPAIDNVIVSFGKPRIMERVRVYNVTGNLVHLIEKRSASSSVSIDTHLLPVGFYSVQLFFQDGVSCCSFIKII